MTSHFFPVPHSCSFCQKLILCGESTIRQQLKAAHFKDLSGIEDIEGILSPRLRKQAFARIGTEKATEAILSLDNVRVFDYTVEEARNIADAGCTLFSWIMEDWKDYDGSESFIAASISMRGVHFGVFQIGRIWRGTQFEKRGRFQLIALKDNPASEEVSTRPHNLNPKSAESMSMAQTWKQACLNSHQDCQRPKRNFMPSRVLQITQREVLYLQLCETQFGTPQPYIALSYKWGGDQSIKTTSKSINRHMLGIPVSEFPATVRDTVRVATELGINKLWIDALCIIQDDQEDKDREIAQMPLIYSQATVTLLASRSNSVNEGFLHQRPRLANDTPGEVFELPFKCINNQMGSVILLPDVDEPEEPLNSRAWALQERFLSPRVLDYSSLQTRWICQETLKGPCGFLSDGYRKTRLHLTRSYQYFEETSRLVLKEWGSTSPTADELTKLRQHWYDLVESYCHRDLTLSTDRLPAISGIAAQYGRVFNDEYKAGHWKSTLSTELFWCIMWGPEDPPARPQQYQGPSWSWAAVNTPIKFPSTTKEECWVEVIECHVTPQATNPKNSLYDNSYAAVKAGFLKVKGALRAAELVSKVEERQLALKYSYLLYAKHTEAQEDILPSNTFLDALEPEFQPGGAVSMPVFLLKVRSTGVKGFILRQQDDATFSRIGLFSFTRSREGTTDWMSEESGLKYQKHIAWLSAGPVQTITII